MTSLFLGDFAVLLRAGMSPKQAICYNLLSATLAVVGMFLGLIVGNVESASSWIFALIGGIFLYVALVDMVRKLEIATLTCLFCVWFCE